MRDTRVVAERLLYSPEGAADVLEASRTTVYELMRSGELESIKVGRSRRIPRAALEAFVEQRRAAGVA